MDRSTAVNEKGEKRSKPKKPIKVVCISNPMKFKASASEFRSLVQKLTGQDSDTADIVSRYNRPYPDDDTYSAVDAAPVSETSSAAAAAAAADPPAQAFNPLELLEGAFDTRIQENFPW